MVINVIEIDALNIIEVLFVHMSNKNESISFIDHVGKRRQLWCWAQNNVTLEQNTNNETFNRFKC